MAQKISRKIGEGKQKKVLSLVLCVAMMLSVMVVGAGAAFSDQSKIKNTEAVDACTALNIIGGYPDGSFKPEGNITRAEVTKMICVALNGGKNPAVSTNTTPTFSDVRNNANAAWAEGYIESCAAQGIVSGVGGGKFAPNGNVTGVQLAKMLLVSLGYKSENEGFTGNAWATNVNMRAAQKGLYKGLETMDTAAAITRDNAAQMVWNALNAYEVEYKTTLTTDKNGQLTSQITVQDKVVGATNDKITLLEDKYDVDKLEAVVVANEYGALEGNVLKEGKTQLKVTTVNDDDWTYDGKKDSVNYSGTYDVTTSLDLLGKKVILFAKDKKTVVGSLIASTDNAVATTTEEKTCKETYDLADDADITIVPGTTKVSANYGNATTLASFNKNDDTNDYNLAGQALTIIDNDDDGNADYIIQVSYRLGEVTKYSTSGKGSITVKTADGNKVYNDSSDVVGFSDVAKDDYVIVTEIGGKLYVNKAKTVTGKLTAYKANDSLTVDGTKYTVAGVLNGKDNATIDTDEFNAAGTYGSSSTLNKDATFYLDNNGYVVAVSSSTGTSDDFAFVWGIERGNFNGDYSVKVTLSDGTTGEYVLTDKDGSIGKSMTGAGTYTSSKKAYGANTEGTDKTGIDPSKKIYTYSINSSKEITLEEIAANKITATDNGAFDFSKNKAKITSGTKTLYGDKETVFFNVEYKTNKTDIKKVNVYTGIASAPSITANGTNSKLNSYLVATSATGTTAAAVVTLDATTSANGDYLYLYGYKGTNNDGAFYRAVVDGKLLDGKDNNNYLFTDDNQQYADGVYEYTVTADGLYQIKNKPANVAAGVITTLSGNSVIVNDVEYTLKDSTKIATIDGDDTTVGDKLSKDDLVVLVYDQNGSDKDLTGAFIVNASAEATITNVNGATVDIDGTDITVTGTVNAATPESSWNFPTTTKSFLRFKLEAPAGVTVDKSNFSLTVKGPNATNTYNATQALESDNSLDLVLGLEAGANNKTFTITAKWNSTTTVVYTVDVDATVA